jgi:uncharacterized protein YcbX
MEIEVGRVAAIYRYAVKSMAGERLEAGELGWHGLEGDRRFAFRRLAERGGFPWLSAGRLPELVSYVPVVRDGVPTHVRTPDGRELEIDGDDLRAELSQKHKSEVELMRLKHGMFDDAPLSVISRGTIDEIARRAEREPDERRFRPNVVVETAGGEPFEEDRWVGGILAFGDPASGAAVGVTQRDVRCSMVNLDPDTAEVDAAMLKTVVRLNENCAGVYCAVVRTGAIEVGQSVLLVKRD